MSHTLVLTKVQQTEVVLSDEEYAEYEESDPYDYLDVYWSDMDTVERSIEEI